MNSVPMLVSASMDATIRFWDVHTRRPIDVLNHKESQVNCLAISPDSTQLAAAGWEKVRIYDTNSPTTQNMHTFHVHEKNVTTLGYQAEGMWMFTGGEDGMAKIWDMRANQLTCQRIFQVNTAVHCVALHPNQIELIVADSTGALYLWDLRSDRDDSLVTEVDLSEYVVHVELDQTGRQCAAVTNRGHLFMWNIHTGTLAQTQKPSAVMDPYSANYQPECHGLMEMAPLGPPPPTSPMEDVYNAPYGVGAATSDLYTIMSNIQPSWKTAAHDTFTLKCHFTPDGLSVATTAADYTAKIWNATEFELRREFRMPQEKWVWECAFTNDSKYMFTASSDGFMRMWNVEDGKEVGTYQGHTMGVTAMAFKDVNYY